LEVNLSACIADETGGRLEPIALAIARAGKELDAVVAMIHELEDVVGHAITTAKTTEELQIEELQQLDRVRQKIEGAAGFLNALTQILPHDWVVDAGHAAKTVAMSDLARRLGGHQDLAHAGSSDDPYELF
jgi:hypothetical protein